MSKRIIALLLALVMVFALCACGNGGNGGNSAGTEDVGDETYTIRIACENSDSYPATLGLYQMEKYVESHTNGKVAPPVSSAARRRLLSRSLRATSRWRSHPSPRSYPTFPSSK